MVKLQQVEDSWPVMVVDMPAVLSAQRKIMNDVPVQNQVLIKIEKCLWFLTEGSRKGETWHKAMSMPILAVLL